MIGKIISHYKILEKIGEGGMGVVYKARDTRLDRVVALKFLPKHLLCEQEARQRFEQEARAASALDHPNIATVYDIDEAGGECFISMAYIEGKSIKELLKEKSFSIGEILNLAVQICEGLAAAHERGIGEVERDVRVNQDGDNFRNNCLYVSRAGAWRRSGCQNRHLVFGSGAV
jgi:serine/threonine protein kinase